MNIKDYIENATYEIKTYGCQMNVHDSEKLAGLLAKMGFTPAQKGKIPGILLINTCCVREGAEERVFGNVGALKHVKLKNPGMIIGVCGCMTQQETSAKRLFRIFPFVDIIFGTNDMQNLPEMVRDVVVDKKRVFLRSEPEGIVEFEEVRRNEPPLCSVNIMYGCDNFCTYCIVPFVRGRERSRKADDIVKEVKNLVDEGYKEVVLLGQNVNSYSGGISFAELLKEVSKTGIDRIRFVTSHPKDISRELIEVMASENAVCPQLHLPVQSGSNAILARMNRNYTVEKYLKTIDLARELVPGIAISTDIIVGFPGETDEDFAHTMQLMERVRFDAAYTFVYSKRTGTEAADYENQVDRATKKQRIMEIVQRQAQITLEGHEARVGERTTILVEGTSKRGGGVTGRTPQGITVNIADNLKVGTFADVVITSAKRTTLMGEII